MTNTETTGAVFVTHPEGMRRTVGVFPAELDSVRAVRRMVESEPGATPEAVAIASELAANAIEHATPDDTPQQIAVGVDQLPGGPTAVYVADNSSELPKLSTDDGDWLTKERGRGLPMVAALANSWSTTTTVPQAILYYLPSAKKVTSAVVGPDIPTNPTQREHKPAAPTVPQMRRRAR